VRIVIADKLDPDLVHELAKRLNITLVTTSDKTGRSNRLLSDDEDIQTICDKITICSGVSGYLLNAYPHNVIQAQSLDLSLARIGTPLSAIIMSETTKSSQKRENKALIRYYRSQNKLIFIDESSSVEDISTTIQSIYEKRRSQPA